MKTEDILKLRENLQIASGFDANRTYPILFQHLGYRKRVAEQLLREPDEVKSMALKDLFDHVNDQIKLIIGI